ncbi:MAG TPA: hypothetical protein VGE88_08705, partial [Lysobacter sp.]
MNDKRPRAGCVAVAAATLGCLLAMPALAQTTAPAPASPPEDTDEDAVEQAATSTEQGQTRMNEAFAPRDRAQWIRDTRRKAFQDTKWDLQVRSFYLDREKYDDTA